MVVSYYVYAGAEILRGPGPLKPFPTFWGGARALPLFMLGLPGVFALSSTSVEVPLLLYALLC